jgi:Na+-transporting NADH:ubiquinone oxidoreductase subunit NqrF
MIYYIKKERKTMKYLIILISLFVSVSFAYAGEKEITVKGDGKHEITFTDGNKMEGYFYDNGIQLCKNIAGGSVCFDKEKIKSVKEIKEPVYGANTKVIEPEKKKETSTYDTSNKGYGYYDYELHKNNPDLYFKQLHENSPLKLKK